MDFEPSGERCPLCSGSSLVRHIVVAHDTDRPSEMTVLQCTSCDFAWQWPIVRGAEESLQFFRKNYAASEGGSYFDKTSKRELCVLEIEFVNSLVAERGSLLDVGSGDGTFAEVASEQGWNSCGVDPAGPEKDESSDGKRFRLLNGAVSDLEEDARFDVITLWDVVEHLERPLELIADCRKRLAPDGWLVLETGNFQSTGRVLAGKGWWCYQNDHRWYFTPKSLREMLKRLGFSKFRLCEKTLRPWVGETGNYRGPAVQSYLLSSIKRPWNVFRNANEFRQLTALSRACPDTAHLQIFTLAAQAAA